MKFVVVLLLLLAPFFVNGHPSSRIKGSPPTRKADNATTDDPNELESLRILKKKVPAPPTCAYAPEITGSSVLEFDGILRGCIQSSDKYCGEKLRLLPPEGGSCNAQGGEVEIQVSLSAGSGELCKCVYVTRVAVPFR